MARWILGGRFWAAALVLLASGLLSAPAALAQEDPRGLVAPTAPAAGARLERRAGWDLTVEGALTLFEDPEGLLGERSPAGDPAFDWGAHSYEAAYGVRVTVGRRIGGGQRWELRGAWLGESDDSSRQTGRFGFRPTPGGGLLLSPTASATLRSETEMWSGELNGWKSLRCDPCSQLDWGLGARVIALDDEVGATDWVGLAPDSFLGAQAENRFLGAQIMAAWRQRPSPRFQLNVSGKLLVGWIHRDMTEHDVSIVTGGVSTDAAREETDLGWGFEAEVSALWRVLPRIGLTASYTLLYLSDVTRIGTALDLAQAATGSVQIRDTTESALIHSFFVGVRIDL